MTAVLAYLAFDDTDTRDSAVGTGRLMRRFCRALSDEYHLKGVLRHQLPRLPEIPFTSNNSSACALIEIRAQEALNELAARATDFLLAHSVPGSDPGLCAGLAAEVDDDLVRFGVTATGERMSQADAMKAVNGFVLRGLGGTNDGIIGAAAAVGLSRYGWCGRFIELGRMRELRDPLRVADLQAAGIRVLSVDRDPTVPLPMDRVITDNWVRPSLWAGEPVLQVMRLEDAWRAAHGRAHHAEPKS